MAGVYKDGSGRERGRDRGSPRATAKLLIAPLMAIHIGVAGT